MRHGQNRRSNDKRSIKLSECKELFANKRIFVDYIPLVVTAYSLKSMTIAVTKCKNASLFSQSSLRSLLRSSEEGIFDGAMAYSLDGENLSFRYSCLFQSEKTKFALFSSIGTELQSRYGKRVFLLRDESSSENFALRILPDGAVLEEDER